MGIFDKSNYIVNTGRLIMEQIFQCTTKVIHLAKNKLWTFYENVVTVS